MYTQCHLCRTKLLAYFSRRSLKNVSEHVLPRFMCIFWLSVPQIAHATSSILFEVRRQQFNGRRYSGRVVNDREYGTSFWLYLKKIKITEILRIVNYSVSLFSYPVVHLAQGWWIKASRWRSCLKFFLSPLLMNASTPVQCWAPGRSNLSTIICVSIGGQQLPPTSSGHYLPTSLKLKFSALIPIVNSILCWKWHLAFLPVLYLSARGARLDKICLLR